MGLSFVLLVSKYWTNSSFEPESKLWMGIDQTDQQANIHRATRLTWLKICISSWMRGYCVTLKMRPDKWRSSVAVEGADRLHMFMLFISFPSYFIYLQYIVCPPPLCKLKLYVSACTESFSLCFLHLPLLSVDWGSVQCSHVIRLLILSRQRGSMSSPRSTPLLTLHLKASLSLTNYHTQLPQSKQLSHASVTDNSFCVQFLKSCLSGKFRLGDIGTVCPTYALSVQMSVLLCW